MRMRERAARAEESIGRDAWPSGHNITMAAIDCLPADSGVCLHFAVQLLAPLVESKRANNQTLPPPSFLFAVLSAQLTLVLLLSLNLQLPLPGLARLGSSYSLADLQTRADTKIAQ